MLEAITERNTPQRLVMVLVALCLLLMLFVLLKERFRTPSLVFHRLPEQGFQGGPTGVPKDLDDVGAMMQELQQQPHNVSLLLRLVDALMRSERLDAAEQFARRALSVDERSFRGHFLLGILLHQKNQDQASAQELETALTIQDDAPTRYSLAILYLYFLHRREEGLKHLLAAQASPNLSPDLQKVLNEEIAKQQKPSSPGAQEQNPASTEKR